jgi:hypothetical protein
MTPLRRAGAALAWALSGGIFLRKLAVPLYDPDLWWHLAAGREMVRRGGWMRTDVFSHTMAGVPWVNFEWLSQLAFYGVHRAGGLWAIYAFKILLSLSALGLLTWTARRCGARGGVLLSAAWAGFLLLRPRLFERTELFTLNFLPLLVLLALGARSSEKVRRALPWAVAGLMVLWVNLHAGFIYGLAALAAFAAGARWAEEDAAFVGALDRAFAWGLAAVLVNPDGPGIAGMFVEVFVGLRGAAVIDEWRPAAVAALPFFWAAFLAVGSASVWTVLRGPRRARLWVPPAVLFAVLGSGHYRSTVLLAFFAVPFLVSLAGALRPRAAAGLWAVVGVVIFLNAGALRRAFPRDPLAANKVPAGACRFILDNGVRGTLFNVYDEGGYIEWALGPERKSFIDGRYIFMPLLEEQTALLDLSQRGGGDAAWRAFMDRNGVDVAVTKSLFPSIVFPGAAPFPLRATNLMFPRDRWALVYWDDAGLVFLKRGAAFDALIKAREYRWVWPYNMDQMRYALGAGGMPLQAFRAELERHKAETGGTAAENEMRALLKPAPAGGAA